MQSRYDPKEVEPRIGKFWDDEKVFAFDPESERPVYAIDTPPPTVSGDIHLGHVFSYSQAEFIARYKRMRGYSVFYPFGLDNNGLPTELLVEKKYKTTAEDLGREKFIGIARNEIKEYDAKYVALFRRLGLSVDISLLYETISERVQKVSQRSFIELHKMGRIYRRKAPALFCPKCKTTVSQMELSDKTLKSKLVQIRFTDKIIIATSRPELLPACVALFTSPDDERYKALIGTEVKVPIFGNTVKVLADPSINPAFGTGIEMCCTFGDQNDINLYKAYDLPLRMAIDEKGRMSIDPYKGMGIKEAREKIVEELKGLGLVIKEEDLEHSVNTHERCGTEIEFIVKDQWYLKYLDLKEKFIELGRQVHWYPDYMRVRYENWVNGLKWDWGLSRQRFSGVYFPVWYCVKCGEVKLAREEDLPVNPFVDKPKERCSACGSDEFVPETDIMDTWATSSLTPLINARWGLDDKYVKKILPMSLRVNSHEIISFWDFTTIVKSFLHTGAIPWANVMISGQGLDPHGKPMHKHLGNVSYPEPFLEKYGADAVRYWASSSSLGDDNSFQEKDVVSGLRLVNKMWNLARFIEMKCKDCTPEKSSGSAMDNYMLRRLSNTIKKATSDFEDYDYFNARSAVEAFFWDFANDYLEFVKKRIYDNENVSKYMVNSTMLMLMKLFSPFVPFATEEMYQGLYRTATSEKSIHISKWPDATTDVVYDEKLADLGEKAAKVVLFVRQWKHDNKLALNAPIKELVVEGLEGADSEISGAMNIATVSHGKGELEIPDIGVRVTVVR